MVELGAPGHLDFDDMGFDEVEEPVAVVDEVGEKRGRKKKPVS